jgi:hypothetical protein
VEDKGKEAKEKEKAEAEITGRVTRRLFPSMSNRLVTKLWVSGGERRASPRRKWAIINHWASLRRLLRPLSSRLVTKLGVSRSRRSVRERASGNHLKLLPTMSSRLVTKLCRSERESGSHWVSRLKVACYYVQTPSDKYLSYSLGVSARKGASSVSSTSYGI